MVFGAGEDVGLWSRMPSSGPCHCCRLANCRTRARRDRARPRWAPSGHGARRQQRSLPVPRYLLVTMFKTPPRPAARQYSTQVLHLKLFMPLPGGFLLSHSNIHGRQPVRVKTASRGILNTIPLGWVTSERPPGPRDQVLLRHMLSSGSGRRKLLLWHRSFFDGLAAGRVRLRPAQERCAAAESPLRGVVLPSEKPSLNSRAAAILEESSKNNSLWAAASAEASPAISSCKLTGGGTAGWSLHRSPTSTLPGNRPRQHGCMFT